MDNNFTNIEFVRRQADSFGERSKIYEKPDYTPQPPDYKGKLPWTVQQQIAASNGIQYADMVEKLAENLSNELSIKKLPFRTTFVYLCRSFDPSGLS